MRTQRALSVAGCSLCIATAALLMGGCSSVPTPAEADGSSRVPANDPERVQALQQRVHADRALLTENNLLRAQVDALQAKLAEMTTIVRDALMLPPAAKAPTSLAPNSVPLASALAPQAMAVPGLPTYVYSAHAAGVVIRVFHPFAHTAFEPSEQVTQALRASVRGADLIEVRGYTDSNVLNPHDQQIAIARAEKARHWLIDNGADPARIHTQHFAAGHFLTDNRSPQGRSLNRRVEVDIRSQQLAGSKLASND